MSSANAAKRPVVLIVEDDLLIRLHAAQIIEEAEFDVIEASSADRFLKPDRTSPFCSRTFKCRAAWMA